MDSFNLYGLLTGCNLFSGLDKHDIERALDNTTYQIKSYSEGEMVASNGDRLVSMKIVIEGIVSGEMIDFSGKTIKIEDIEAPSCLAPAFLFGDNNTYPVDIIAGKDVSILSLSKHDFLVLLSKYELILNNYLNIISSRAQFISARLRFMSFQSIKGKIAHYILDLSSGNAEGKIVMDRTHNQLSELFGVARPSLSRALGSMNRDGIISVRGRNIEIIDRDKLLLLLS